MPLVGFEFQRTVTRGIISAVNRTIKIEEEGEDVYLQTDATINPSNSGGPLIDIEGKVVAINTIKNNISRRNWICSTNKFNKTDNRKLYKNRENSRKQH